MSLQEYFYTKPIVSVEQLKQIEISIESTTYLALGGGLGSFAWVDHLRIYGVPIEQIRVIGVTSKPHARYRRLCTNSQIPEGERLRSDSGSTPDNIWGWPGYAVREIGRATTRGRLFHAGRIAFQIFSETAISNAYTPQAGAVYRSLEQESQRIGWHKMWRYGRIRTLRKTDDGRYAILCEQSDGQPYLVIALYVHLAFGYPRIRLLPELQNYRQEFQDRSRVVNAYEEHEHLYQHLSSHGGMVVLRGRGIVASRILQRIADVRNDHPDVDIRVIHLMRSPQSKHTRYEKSQRVTEHHWQLQPFNFPKACFTGSLRTTLAQADGDERQALFATWAGTTTADRADWRRIVAQGLKSGWYQIRFGELTHIRRSPDTGHDSNADASQSTRIVITIDVRSALDEAATIATDFVIDCTGLSSELDANPVLRDLLRMYDLPRNSQGNLFVTPDFEVDALWNNIGYVYASGVITFGGSYGPVDSFLGLQYAAYRSVESLIRRRASSLRPLTPLRSLNQWTRWVRQEAP